MRLYLPRPLKLPSSSGSSNEEERWEKAALRSGAVWTSAVGEALAGATGVAGWGLRNPVRLSRGTVVTDAAVTSADLTWGFRWFLLEEEEERKIWQNKYDKCDKYCIKTHTYTHKHTYVHTQVTSVSCGGASTLSILEVRS